MPHYTETITTHGKTYMKANYYGYTTLCDAEKITPTTIYLDPRCWSKKDITAFLEDLQVIDNDKYILFVRNIPKSGMTGKHTRVATRVKKWLDLQ